MEDPHISGFISNLMRNDLAQAIPYPIPYDEALKFSDKVLDRFRNPLIKHQWLGICTNYTMKLKTRVIPVLLNYYEKYQRVPENIAFGIAAYLRFMRSAKINGNFIGLSNEKQYQIDDEWAGYYSELWAGQDIDNIVNCSFSNAEIWGTELSQLPGFAASVKTYLRDIENEGAKKAIQNLYK